MLREGFTSLLRLIPAGLCCRVVGGRARVLGHYLGDIPFLREEPS